MELEKHLSISWHRRTNVLKCSPIYIVRIKINFHDIAIMNHTNNTASFTFNETQSIKLLTGDSRYALGSFPSDYFQCCVTSPPYWGLRDYDMEGQIGAEDIVDVYLDDLVTIFREVKRTLKSDGTLWLNIGDSYTSGNRTWRDSDKKKDARGMAYRPPTPEGLKPKDLIGIPWRIALALQQDGWYLRSDIIWHKPNCQPESVKDRPTRSHEYIFLFSKSEKYFYDSEAILEPCHDSRGTRNRRSVWSINTVPYKGAHFAVFPKELVRLCVLAGSKPDSYILDPFSGSGTVAEVCVENNRNCVGIELNPNYIKLAQERLSKVTPQLAFPAMAA